MTPAFSAATEALFRLEVPTAVSAGAGSGKTTALVELCVRILSGEALGAPCDPGEVAAITFTDRAGAELVERLRTAVAERAALAGDGEALAWWARLGALDRMAAGTIHGFCGRLLREHAPEAGLDPDFVVLDEERATSWLAEAARGAALAALDRADPDVSAFAARDGLSALAAQVADLVRARATRGERGAPAVAEGDEAAAIAARGRALEAAEALARAGSPASAGVAEALAALAPEDRSGSFSGEGLARLEVVGRAAKGGRLSGAAKAARDALGLALEEATRGAADVLGLSQRRALAALVADAETRFAARKEEASAVDFDDLLRLARDLLRGDGAVRAELRVRLRALLVDEYQDVNGVQQELFDLLAGPGQPAGPLLVAVGDAKQSIYRFRGADLGVFTRLLRRLAGGAGRVLHQAENFRSAPAVLELVNAVSGRALQPPAGAAPRDDELAFGPEDRLVARRPEGARPACDLLADVAEGSAAELRAREAVAVARRVKAILSGEAGVRVRERDGDRELSRPPRPEDVALLFRRLTEVDVYERALRSEGIPYRVARGQGFYQASEVRDLSELLAVLFDPGDVAAWAAVLRSPWCAVSDGTLYLLARGGLWRLGGETAAAVRARVEADAGAGAVPDEEWMRLGALLETYAALRPLRDRLPVQDLVGRAVDALDLDAALLAGPEGDRRIANLDKALALAARVHAEGGGAQELVSHLRAMARRPAREPEGDLEAADAVAILSIHQAKGLEWPVVFVPDLGARPWSERPRPMLDEAGRLCAPFHAPLADLVRTTATLEAARAMERRSERAESRRLLYVALTRARDHLVLSGEAGRAGAETWRTILEPTLASRPDLVRRLDASAVPAPVGDATPVPTVAVAQARSPRLAGPPPPAALRLAVTALSEAFRCPRRHHLGQVMGLAEPRGESGMPTGDDPGRATARGTLAHAMVAEADLAAPPLERRAQLAAAAARRGHDPDAPGVRRILAEVARFADSPAGKELARAAKAGRLRREVPFLLRLEGEPGEAQPLYLDGAIDALVTERGEVRVLDYKYALPRPGAAERYRYQLLAYAVAASRAFPGTKVRAALQFLRGDHRVLDLTPDLRALEAFVREAPLLARELQRGAGERTPAELGRTEARCRAEGCGFVTRCHARPA